MTSQLTWTPPGPGTWDLLADHYPRPISATMAGFAEVWSQTSTEWMHEVGLPIDEARMSFVNGFGYVSIGGGGGSRTPPAWVMKLMTHLLPSLRRAERRLTAVMTQRPWVPAIARWYEHERPAAIERMRRLGGTDLDRLDDEELATHLGRVLDEVMASARQHLALHAHDSFPPGMFVVRAIELGLSRDAAVRMLTGSSPASAARSDELTALRAAVAGRTVGSLDELRALGPDVSAALDAYLAVHGARLVDGYDVDARTIGELPSLVCHLATRPDGSPTEPALPELASLSPAERAELAQLLEDARSAYGVRDDNSGILVAWPAGLLRLAMLAAGRRLVGAGRLDRVELALEATVAELGGALRGAPLPADLADRAHYRATHSTHDAPRRLGPAQAPAPEGLGGSLGRVFAAFSLFENEPSTGPMSGLGIGTEPYTGTARIVTAGADAIDQFAPGEVLVAPMTSPSFNAVLALAGALVTDEGGVMSHAAIMARELAIPAVIGAGGATRSIRDGDLVTVDPVAGRVTVVQPSPPTAGVIA